jgi:hypothetical protein
VAAAAKPITVQMVEAVQSRLADLRKLSFPEIQALPEAATTESEILGTRVKFTVYRAPQSPDRTLVVAQALRDRWFGITTEIHVAGFIASSSGEKLEASEKLLWDYE